ncbi:MAG: hypothetical protein ACXWNK_07940 [Vulcanimicrobiaceae bacterium]
MTIKPKISASELFNNDDLDEAVISADDTGMVAEQHEVVEEEILLGEEGKLPPRGEPPE